MLLAAPDGSPLLATAQMGLGRVLAWASDLTGRWAIDWVSWAEFPRFTANLVTEVLPLSNSDRLSLTATVIADQVEIDLTAQDAGGLPIKLNDIRSRISGLALECDLEFTQIAPGRYRAVTTIDQVGAYLIQVYATDQADQPLGNARIGVTVNYAPEYGRNATNPGLLAELVALTGGQVDPPPAAIFAPTERTVYEVWPVTIPLLWLALALLPIDVALRRLFVPFPDWQAKMQPYARRKGTESVETPASRPDKPLSAPPPNDEERIAALLAAKRRQRREE
jgi:hypothetical protein